MADYSIKARWGDELLDKGLTCIPNLVLDLYSKLDITSEELLFILLAFSFKWDERNPFPSCRTIAAKMGKKKRTVQAYAQSLENKGYLIRKPRLGRSSELDFSPLLDAIKQQVTKNPAPHAESCTGGMQDAAPPPVQNPAPRTRRIPEEEKEEEDEPVFEPSEQNCQSSGDEVSKQVITHYSEEADEKVFRSLQDADELEGILKIQEHWKVTTKFEFLPARIAAYWLFAYPRGLWNHLEEFGLEKAVQLVTRAMDQAFELHKQGRIRDLIGYLNAGIQNKNPYLID